MVSPVRMVAQGLLGRERVSLAEPVISTPPATPAKTAQTYAALDDAQVVEKCAAGDPVALGELYKRYKAEALRFIRHAVRNTQDADDILQEVFVEVARSLKKFEGRAAFSTWLHRICVRTAVRQMKKRYRQVGESASDDSRPEPADLRPGPDEESATRDRAKRVRALLEQLAPKKRMVLVLHDLEGVSPKEISDLVGAPVLTVRTRLFYARRELAALAARDPALAEFFPAEGGVSDVLSA